MLLATRHPPRIPDSAVYAGLTYERSWPWNHIVGRLWPVQLELDTWICTFICAWEAYITRAKSARTSCEMSSGCNGIVMTILSLHSAGTLYVDLRALHVELCAWIVGSSVKCNDLSS
jgi:hypothetical protein